MKHFTERIPSKLLQKLIEAGYKNSQESCATPTYAEVLDWLFDKGVFIELTPSFTFALIDNMGFEYCIRTIDTEEPKLTNIPGKDYASFKLTMNAAIEESLGLLKQN